MSKPTYVAEYAKSNRSKCYQCKSEISKDTVRIGKLERSPFFDGEVYQFRHVACFFKRYKPTFADLKGAEDMKWNDQQRLRGHTGEKVEEEKKESSDAAPSTSSSTDKPPAESSAGVQRKRMAVSASASSIELAKSARSTCRACERAIEKGALRVGGSSGWLHADCARVSEGEVEKEAEKEALWSSLKGWAALSDGERERARALLAESEGEKEGAAREGEKEGEGAKELAGRALAEALWSARAEFESSFSRDEMRALLGLLRQSVAGGPSELLARLADCRVRGLLPVCPACAHPSLARDADKIFSEWSKCTYSVPADSVARTPFVMPQREEIEADAEEMRDKRRQDKLDEEHEAEEIAKMLVGDKKRKASEEVKDKDKKEKKGKGKGKGKKTEEDDEANKAEDEEEQNGSSEKVEERKQFKGTAMVESDSGFASKSGVRIYTDGFNFPFSCALSQTDMGIGSIGKNSFYKSQVLEINKNRYILFNAWGRLGGEANHLSKEFRTPQTCVTEFVKNFHQKTGCHWSAYVNGTFSKQPGAFFPVDIALVGADDDDEGEGEGIGKSEDKKKSTVLERGLADFLRLIFSTDCILDTMKQMKIDVKKLPLGKLSRGQVQKGYQVLEEVETELKKENPQEFILKDLSNKFYTLVPHVFSNGVAPPPLTSIEILRSKYELLNVLADIEVAASILKGEKNASDPLLNNYEQLDCQMERLKEDSVEFQQINTYFKQTKTPMASGGGFGYFGGSGERSIVDVFRVNRGEDDARYAQFDHLDNRKILWHGTKLAVVAAILKSSLRIMPHSGGRVGRGIYLASENSKSAAYVGSAQDPFGGNVNTGVMFLCEAALGNQHTITMDNSSFVKAPAGSDSVLAIGASEPDVKDDIKLTIDGREVVMPQGKPVHNPLLKGGNSNFSQSEYLVYNEAQVRIRYVLKMRWS